MKVGFVSLGCSKNLVDTEMCIGIFRKENFEIVNSKEEAEIIVVNTCGFIEPAKEEAINTILEMAKFKEIGNCKYLIVIGCLVERYKKELEKALPEVDLFLSIDEYKDFWGKVSNLLKLSNKSKNTLDYMDRVISTGNTTAYLKIAEGCSNRCTYCAIPYIRGPYISRKFEDILKEAKMLASKGIKELIVIAQDTTKYGFDLYNKDVLSNLHNNKSPEDRVTDIKKIINYDLTKENAEKYYYTKTKYPNYFVSRDEFKNSDKENRINLDEQIDEMYQFYQCRRGMYVRKNKSGVCPTLTANMGTGGHNVPLIKVSDGIRKLTPTETFKLQGFPVGNGYDLPKEFKGKNYPDSQLYKQAGNAVSVPVITTLAEELLKILEKNDNNQNV